MLKMKYEKLEDIPENYRDLYTEVNGVWSLTGVSGLKTQDDTDRLQESLRKERADHKATKQKLQRFGDMDPDDVMAKLDRIEELEQAAGGKLDENKINEMVETRIKSRIAPYERKIQNLEDENRETKIEIDKYKNKETIRTIHDDVRKAMKNKNVVPTAEEDILFLSERVMEINELGRVVTKDGHGTTAGVDPVVWLTEMQERRPHWWPQSEGAGASGGSGSSFTNNPFSHEHWNLTEQGKIVRENRERAQQMAKAAGTEIAGPKPPPKK